MSDSMRRVRSYVIRKARMSEAQKAAYAELSGEWVLPFEHRHLNWAELFPRASRTVVEIGFGMGDATRRVAADHPDWGILGVEVHRPGVGKLLWWIDREDLDNIRIVEHDAVEVLESMVPPCSVDGIHLWFPDPWPKKRHHKRRLVNPAFAALVVRSLKNGGYVHAATDWEPYAQAMYDVFDGTEGLANRHRGWAPKPDYRPDTKFENRGMAAERVIRDLIFEKELP